MTINAKRAEKRQTVLHFADTFMNDYETEKAADRTMKSRYVPRNLKTQLVSTMSGCDPGDRKQIERVARLGIFIDTCCTKLVFYNTMTIGVIRWIVSLYSDSPDIKRIGDMVISDARQVYEEDIQFIMEKYRYMEESGLFHTGDHVESVFEMLKARKQSPETPLLRYFFNSVWLRFLKSILRNSMVIFNDSSFVSAFTGVFDDDGGRDDEESHRLYNDYREKQTEWMKEAARTSRENVDSVVNSVHYYSASESGDDAGGRNPWRAKAPRRPPRPPPDISLTAFDMKEEDDDDDGDDVENDYDEDGGNYSDSETSGSCSETGTVVECPTKCGGGDSTVGVAEDGVVGRSGTTVVATITLEKRLHILDDDLNDILMEEKTSKALCTQTGDGAESTETLETKITRRSRDARDRDTATGGHRLRHQFPSRLCITPSLGRTAIVPYGGGPPHRMNVLKKKRKCARRTPWIAPLELPSLPLPPPPSQSSPTVDEGSNDDDDDEKEKLAMVLYTDGSE